MPQHLDIKCDTQIPPLRNMVDPINFFTLCLAFLPICENISRWSPASLVQPCSHDSCAGGAKMLPSRRSERAEGTGSDPACYQGTRTRCFVGRISGKNGMMSLDW